MRWFIILIIVSISNTCYWLNFIRKRGLFSEILTEELLPKNCGGENQNVVGLASRLGIVGQAPDRLAQRERHALQDVSADCRGRSDRPPLKESRLSQRRGNDYWRCRKEVECPLPHTSSLLN